MLLKLITGDTAPIDSIVLLDNPVTVYNFSVPGLETYYAGSAGVLVHNCPGIDLNKAEHIFGKSEHGLDGVLNQFGGKRDEAMGAIQEALNKATAGAGPGKVEVVVNVAGSNVTVRGMIVNGEAKIGTAFIAKP